MQSVSKQLALAPCEVEEKLSVAIMRANEVVETDVKSLSPSIFPALAKKQNYCNQDGSLAPFNQKHGIL